MATLGLFAVAFLVRPFGGLFLDPLADRIGRNESIGRRAGLRRGARLTDPT